MDYPMRRSWRPKSSYDFDGSNIGSEFNDRYDYRGFESQMTRNANLNDIMPSKSIDYETPSYDFDIRSGDNPYDIASPDFGQYPSPLEHQVFNQNPKSLYNDVGNNVLGDEQNSRIWDHKMPVTSRLKSRYDRTGLGQQSLQFDDLSSQIPYRDSYEPYQDLELPFESRSALTRSYKRTPTGKERRNNDNVMNRTQLQQRPDYGQSNRQSEWQGNPYKAMSSRRAARSDYLSLDRPLQRPAKPLAAIRQMPESFRASTPISRRKDDSYIIEPYEGDTNYSPNIRTSRLRKSLIGLSRPLVASNRNNFEQFDALDSRFDYNDSLKPKFSYVEEYNRYPAQDSEINFQNPIQTARPKGLHENQFSVPFPYDTSQYWHNASASRTENINPGSAFQRGDLSSMMQNPVPLTMKYASSQQGIQNQWGY